MEYSDEYHDDLLQKIINKTPLSTETYSKDKILEIITNYRESKIENLLMNTINKSNGMHFNRKKYEARVKKIQDEADDLINFYTNSS